MDQFLNAVKANAEKAGVFGEVKVVRAGGGDMLQCAAAGSAEPAWYRLEQVDGHWHVALVTANRWLSESIEADLMHHGDPIEELIEEELAELDYHGKPLTVKHFRSDDMLYTFLSPVPINEQAAVVGRRSLSGQQAGPDSTATATAATIATQCLLGYEAAFRRLGDMEV